MDGPGHVLRMLALVSDSFRVFPLQRGRPRINFGLFLFNLRFFDQCLPGVLRFPGDGPHNDYKTYGQYAQQESSGSDRQPLFRLFPRNNGAAMQLFNL